MTDALVEINDRLAEAAWPRYGETTTFFCECGDCLAECVALSLDEHDEIRAREDLIFAPGHETPRRYRKPHPLAASAPTGAQDLDEWMLVSGSWRGVLIQSLSGVARRTTT
jgi:hypothetical protein